MKCVTSFALASMAVALLAGCASAKDTTTAYTTELAAYAGAVAAESAYISTGKADSQTVLKLEIARLQAHTILTVMKNEIDAGQVPSSTEQMLAQQSVAALMALVPENLPQPAKP